MLCVEGQISSYFLELNISMPTRWTLAWPCFPVLEVDISTILQGRDFNMTKPFLRNAEHCIGYVTEAPESPVSKWVSSISAIFDLRSSENWNYINDTVFVLTCVKFLIVLKEFSDIRKQYETWEWKIDKDLPVSGLLLKSGFKMPWSIQVLQV